jgi:hypothetical protein
MAFAGKKKCVPRCVHHIARSAILWILGRAGFSDHFDSSSVADQIRQHRSRGLFSVGHSFAVFDVFRIFAIFCVFAHAVRFRD